MFLFLVFKANMKWKKHHVRVYTIDLEIMMRQTNFITLSVCSSIYCSSKIIFPEMFFSISSAFKWLNPYSNMNSRNDRVTKLSKIFLFWNFMNIWRSIFIPTENSSWNNWWNLLNRVAWIDFCNFFRCRSLLTITYWNDRKKPNNGYFYSGYERDTPIYFILYIIIIFDIFAICFEYSKHLSGCIKLDYLQKKTIVLQKNDITFEVFISSI